MAKSIIQRSMIYQEIGPVLGSTRLSTLLRGKLIVVRRMELVGREYYLGAGLYLGSLEAINSVVVAPLPLSRLVGPLKEGVYQPRTALGCQLTNVPQWGSVAAVRSP